MEAGATRCAAGEYARAGDAPRLRLRPPADYRAKPPQKRYSVTVLIGKPKTALPLPKIEGPAGAHLPLVVIDAGPGGHDPRTISPTRGRPEKDIPLGLAKAVQIGRASCREKVGQDV